jgi:hypothetical protein
MFTARHFMEIILFTEMNNLIVIRVDPFNEKSLNTHAAIDFNSELEGSTVMCRRSKQMFRVENCVLIS